MKYTSKLVTTKIIQMGVSVPVGTGAVYKKLITLWSKFFFNHYQDFGVSEPQPVFHISGGQYGSPVHFDLSSIPSENPNEYHYCPKQLLSASFHAQPIDLYSADGHCKTRSMTARASCPKTLAGAETGNGDTELIKHGALRPSRSYSLTRKEAPTVRSLSKAKLTKSCFGHD